MFVHRPQSLTSFSIAPLCGDRYALHNHGSLQEHLSICPHPPQVHRQQQPAKNWTHAMLFHPLCRFKATCNAFRQWVHQHTTTAAGYAPTITSAQLVSTSTTPLPTSSALFLLSAKEAVLASTLAQLEGQTPNEAREGLSTDERREITLALCNQTTIGQLSDSALSARRRRRRLKRGGSGAIMGQGRRIRFRR